MAARSLFLLLALASLSSARDAAAADITTPAPSLAPGGWGTLSLRSRAPLGDSRLGFAGGRLRPLPCGARELVIGASQANVWAQMPGYFWDGEWTRLAVRLSWGVAPGLEAFAELAALGRSGGFLDGFIMGFHRLVGCTQARRDRYPRNRLAVAVGTAPGASAKLTDADAGAGLATPSAGVRRTLLASASGHLSAALSLGLPALGGARRFASGAPAVLAEITTEGALTARVHIFGAFGAMLAPFGERLYDIPLSPVQKFLLVGMRLQLQPRAALVAHYLTADGATDAAALAPLDRSTHEFALGLQLALGAVLGEVGLLENSIHDANSADFGLHVAARVPL